MNKPQTTVSNGKPTLDNDQVETINLSPDSPQGHLNKQKTKNNKENNPVSAKTSVGSTKTVPEPYDENKPKPVLTSQNSNVVIHNEENPRRRGSILKKKISIGSQKVQHEPLVGAQVPAEEVVPDKSDKRHTIAFKDDIQEVKIVENWKQYNTDTSNSTVCHCNLI